MAALPLTTALSAAILGLALTAPVSAFELTSPDYNKGESMHLENVFDAMGCKGANLSPALAWKDPPAGTKSYLLTFYDPDAPTGSGWWHWVVYDLPASTRTIAAGITAEKGLPPGAIQGRSDLNTYHYDGACPPPGAPHAYTFTITALSVDKLDVPEDASPARVGYAAHFSSLGSATLVLPYGR